MPGRKFSSNGYRYGFNGKEKDDEIANVEGAYDDFGARMYDSRLGRFLRTDPVHSGFSFETPYAFAGNTPIWAIDKDGEKIYFINEDGAVLDLSVVENIDKIDNLSFKEAYTLLKKTDAGNTILSMYEKSNTHDIYINANDFLEKDDAVATTIFNVGPSVVNKSGEFEYSRTPKHFSMEASIEDAKRRANEFNAQHKGFQGKDASKSKGAISQVSLNKSSFNGTGDKYELAETIYHEIWAHVNVGGLNADEAHELYGKTYYGFYITKETNTPDYERKMNNVDGSTVIYFDYDYVQSYSPAFKIMQQILEIKKETKVLNKIETGILKGKGVDNKKDKSGSNENGKNQGSGKKAGGCKCPQNGN